MMIDPPIDKLITKAECRYALVVGIAKRARIIAEKEDVSGIYNTEKPLSIAAKEVYSGEYVIIDQK